MNHRAPLPAPEPDTHDDWDAWLIEVVAEQRTYDRPQGLREKWGIGR